MDSVDMNNLAEKISNHLQGGLSGNMKGDKAAVSDSSV